MMDIAIKIAFWLSVVIVSYNLNKSLNRDIFKHFKDIG